VARTRTALLCAFTALALLSPARASATGTGTDTTLPAASVTDDTTVWRAENDPSACLNSMPRPDCGYKPQDAGERGGALQVATFFVMIGALAVIGTVIIRNVVRRDREMAARLADGSQSHNSTPK
jgi:hypothetical protein